ncbi:tetratricopeptide repeat protein [Phytohabitans sp. ZYX-F-186]|uniref:Tetratricopeptide repeat protein n=1 Tax=Phytohabitans maris TaxID=3071409 RepID=A0ABU0ZYI2_9ACTN|nr:tetratricopeptide repeat protein [Phytohabitans sp. ZYX-F-186]MDQ7911349.1 tetratricopeptide repeat protein [Phytohabitans sp. ZYX-F-186]
MTQFQRGYSAPEEEISQLMGEALELYRSGHLDRARRKGEQAIALCRELAAAEPDDPRHRRVLASLLYNHAVVLNGMERWAAALAAVQESGRLYEELAGLDPATYEPLHADALTRTGSTYIGLGRTAEAVACQRRAVTMYLSLPPDVGAERGVARAMSLLASSLEADDQPDEAMAAADDALRRYADLDARDQLPLDAAAFYAMSARTLARLRARRGEYEAAAGASAVAVAVYRLLLEQVSPEWGEQLAAAVGERAAHLSAAGRADEGLVQARDVLRLVRTLDERKPDTYLAAFRRLAAVVAALEA